MQKIKYFIWDFDGTLMDTYPHTLEAFMQMMKRHGREADPVVAKKKLRNSFEEAAKFYNLTDEMFNEFFTKANELHYEPMPTVYDGLEEVLKKVIENGGENYIYTHRNFTCPEYLKEFGLIDYFKDMVTSDSEAFAFKPKPDSIEYLVNKYSLPKDATAMVGDREIDVLSGLNAGCKGILFDQYKENRETKADFVFTDFSRLLEII